MDLLRRAQRVADGSLSVDSDELFRLIYQVNPTRSAHLDELERSRLYALKSRLQSRLINEFREALEVVPGARRGEAVIHHRLRRMNAGHARIDQLDPRARAWVVGQLARRARGLRPESKAGGAPESPEPSNASPPRSAASRSLISTPGEEAGEVRGQPGSGSQSPGGEATPAPAPAPDWLRGRILELCQSHWRSMVELREHCRDQELLTEGDWRADLDAACAELERLGLLRRRGGQYRVR